MSPDVNDPTSCTMKLKMGQDCVKVDNCDENIILFHKEEDSFHLSDMDLFINFVK